jgi:glycine/D-amino acid oxidase-like deaminating enzyme
VSGIRTSDGESILADNVILAAGPFNQALCRTLGVELPLFCELHTKVIFDDRLRVAPRDTPLIIWIDRVCLPWSPEERQLLRESADSKWMLEEMPSGVHGRSEGGAGSSYFLLQWTLHTEPRAPVFPLQFDQQYPELALRGLSVMLPALEAYFRALPRFTMDGGYYCKTRENRPLVGPLPVEGAYLIGGLGGFGIMASSAAGDLLASHLTGGPLPRYASAFSLSRYSDPAYQDQLAHWDDTGQL